jgi:hypothetical protein
MIKIAHRGNLKGPCADENKPEHLIRAAALGFFVEVDVWKIDNDWFTGHDEPQYQVDFDFLNNAKFYLHCKNLESLTFLTRKLVRCDFFAHDKDDWVLTDKGQIWTLPWKEVGHNSIIVDFRNKIDWREYDGIYGVCADYF